MALAIALALTTVVTFAMVAVGQEVGMFGSGNNSGEDALAVNEDSATPVPNTDGHNGVRVR
jgi:hypothetical protein